MDNTEILKTEQLNFYRDNGYLHLKNIISEDDVKQCIEDSDIHAARNGLYTNYLDLHHYGKFKELHTGKILCTLGDSVLGDRAIPIGSIFFYCKPNNEILEHGSTWHQDNYASLAPYGAYLNIALSLDFADSENGSLMVVPGSHKLGDLPCNQKPNFARDGQGRLHTKAPIGNDCELPNDLPIVSLSYAPGDLLLVHAHLVHKAERNSHPTRWRRTMYFVYIRDKTPFWPGWTAKRQLLDRWDFNKQA